MKNLKVTGIGCFAKPTTLCRVFKKMVRDYGLGQFDSIKLIDGHQASGADGVELLKSLMAGKAGCFHSPDSESSDVPSNKKITGFFLTLRDQRLNLSIFAKGDSNCRQRYTASLDVLTKLRQKRLR